MNHHTNCPECDALDTEVVHRDWWQDCVKVTRICNECPTEWVINYGDPRVEEVKQYE